MTKRATGWRGPVAVVSALLIVPQAAAAESQSEAEFFAHCPQHRYLELHREDSPLDPHALLYTSAGLMEVEVLRLADWLIDLPLPGAELRPFRRTVHGIRRGYGRLPRWYLIRRFGELVDAFQLPELSLGDVTATYTVATGGMTGPGLGTVVRINKLIDWVQRITGDVNTAAGRLVGRRQGLMTWSVPARATNGLQSMLTQTIHTLQVTIAKTLEHAVSGLERTVGMVVNVGYVAPHRGTTVFMQAPAAVYRADEPWLREHAASLYLGTPEELRSLTHAALFHRRWWGRPQMRPLPDLDWSAETLVLIMPARVFRRAPRGLRTSVVSTAWAFDDIPEATLTSITPPSKLDNGAP